MGAAVAVGVGMGALNLMQSSSAASANRKAVENSNDAIAKAALASRDANQAQADYVYDTNRANVGTQNQFLIGALDAAASARGVTGSRVAEALEVNQEGQSALMLEDLAANKFLTDKEIDIAFANAMNQRTGYDAPSTGLMLLNAGMSGLQAGMSFNSMTSSSSSSSSSSASSSLFGESKYSGNNLTNSVNMAEQTYGLTPYKPMGLKF